MVLGTYKNYNSIIVAYMDPLGKSYIWDSSALLETCSVLDIPIVSIVVPFFGLTNSILRILKGNPKKELQWRLQVVL